MKLIEDELYDTVIPDLSEMVPESSYYDLNIWLWDFLRMTEETIEEELKNET